MRSGSSTLGRYSTWVLFVCSALSYFFFFFFFQAEDGIRDVAVTGVQTCALPIYHRCRTDGDRAGAGTRRDRCAAQHNCDGHVQQGDECRLNHHEHLPPACSRQHGGCPGNGNRQCRGHPCHPRSEEHTAELHHGYIHYAVFCLKHNWNRAWFGLPLVFFFNDTATTEIYTLSLHDALPISQHNCDGHVQQGDECRLNHHEHLPPACSRQHGGCPGNGNRQCRGHPCHPHPQQPTGRRHGLHRHGGRGGD